MSDMSLSVENPILGIPILGFAAFSGVGKTTLIESLLGELRQRGLRVGLIKHAHHKVDVDQPGKDSYRHRQAGANPVLLASDSRWALMSERNQSLDGEVCLSELLEMFRRLYALDSDNPQLDLILVEGFRHEKLAKLELFRPALGHPLLALEDDNIIAVATDSGALPALPQPLLNLNDHAEILSFILALMADFQRPARPHE